MMVLDVGGLRSLAAAEPNKAPMSALQTAKKNSAVRQSFASC
jgi:hypothetical protein